MDSIEKRFQDTRQRITAALKAAKRNDTVKLLAVSKYHPVEKIKTLYQLGQKDFGENYLTEAQEKIEILHDYAINWHFIGPIQSNKTRMIATLFDWVQSVDRLKIAKRLSEQRPQQTEPLNICLQVNINHEEQKSGFLAHELDAACKQILNYPNLCIRGLMAIPEHTDNVQRQRDNFTRLRTLQEQLASQYKLKLDTLSMGMSNDLEAAILEGSNMVRIGTALFGQRNK